MSDVESPLVHVGLHKTGTTWLQKTVFQKAAGKHFRYSEDRALLRGEWGLPNHDDFDPAHTRERVLESLKGSADLPIILSDEILAGRPFHSQFEQGVIMERIAQTFPEAKILITVREQISLIYSAYGHYLRGGHTSSLDRFLAVPSGAKAYVWRPVLDRSYYDYNRLQDRYIGLFGTENVKIVPMEWMIGSTDEFIAAMEAFTGYSWPRPEAASRDRRVNPAWTDLSRAYVRFANRFEDQDSRFARKPGRVWKNAIADKISVATPQGLHKRMRTAAMDKIARSIGDTYAASNLAVAQKTGIDLKRYGYIVQDSGSMQS